MRRNIKKVIVLIAALTLLAGCTTPKELLEQKIFEQSGIAQDEDYIQYRSYAAAGKLDESGQYIVSDEMLDSGDVQQKPDGEIHVTFAENRYLKMAYYYDVDMMQPIDTEMCYVNAGDTIYAKVIEVQNPNSNLYRLSEYRIVQYDAQGNVMQQIREQVGEDTFSYTIPQNFSGSELSVMPIGEYPDRELSMDAYYVDDSGKEHSLASAGIWTINDAHIEGNAATIRAVDTYVLKFTYDADNYFYVGCEPECFTKDPNQTGFVEFWEAKPTDEDKNYRVELHPFLNLSLKFSEEAKIKVNETDWQTVKKNKAFSLEQLRYGDSIVIETAGQCTITDGNYQHINATKDPIKGGYRYALKVVPEAEKNTADILVSVLDVNRTFDVVLDNSCNYGTATYKLDGAVVSGKVKIKEGQELTLTYKITKETYKFKDKAEGVGGFFQNLFNASERTVRIPVTEELNGTTVLPDEWFDIVAKEG